MFHAEKVMLYWQKSIGLVALKFQKQWHHKYQSHYREQQSSYCPNGEREPKWLLGTIEKERQKTQNGGKNREEYWHDLMVISTDVNLLRHCLRRSSL